MQVKEALEIVIRGQTELMRAAFSPSGKGAPQGLSEDRIEIYKSMSEHSSRITEGVIRLDEMDGRIPKGSSKYLKALFSQNRDEVYFEPFCAIVPLRNPNSHDYPIGRVSIAVPDSSPMFWKPSGGDGNSLTRERSCLRPATEEEITSWLASFPLAESTVAAKLFSFLKRHPEYSECVVEEEF